MNGFVMAAIIIGSFTILLLSWYRMLLSPEPNRRRFALVTTIIHGTMELLISLSTNADNRVYLILFLVLPSIIAAYLGSYILYHPLRKIVQNARRRKQ